MNHKKLVLLDMKVFNEMASCLKKAMVPYGYVYQAITWFEFAKMAQEYGYKEWYGTTDDLGEWPLRGIRDKHTWVMRRELTIHRIRPSADRSVYVWNEFPSCEIMFIKESDKYEFVSSDWMKMLEGQTVGNG